MRPGKAERFERLNFGGAGLLFLQKAGAALAGM
jgi:hypothetical protein